jgi:thiosulfate/3-mercaptopyruvate sulfurtransferase
VKQDFLDSTHNGPRCEGCHQGDPKALEKLAAHKGLLGKPSRHPDAACGACHEKQVRDVKSSLHFTLRGEETLMKLRSAHRWPDVQPVFQQACKSCHASCGDCHVSRAKAARGGLLDGHVFVKRPSIEDGCGACHGGRVVPEYLGRNEGFPPDVHWQQGRMDCVACHPAAQLHGDGSAYPDRHAVKTKPSCLTCHPQAAAEGSPIEQHAVHGGKVSCVVCHSTVYKGCESCHVGAGSKSSLQFKIGLSSRPDAPYRYTLLRHVPTVRTMLDPTVKDGLPGYDAVPTWKDTTPHNIQRKTPRTRSCNNCHGNARIFLKASDLNSAEAAANSTVVVPSIPARR